MYKLLFVEFDRIKLDSEGAYEFNDKDTSRAMYNFNNFAYHSPEDLAKSGEPLKIPLAPILPLERKKEALYNYIIEKIPALAADAPIIVENKIVSLKNNHEENINLFKEVQILRRKVLE